ncbi:KAP family NTPase [Odoribacter sp. OttesenSCG-928-J03]|nr:KAP family NTPase [Odoribacter sp. OttesenSCG-928-J03]
MKEDLPYKFLQNIPIGEDLFEGQSQEKIACVISENIENNDFQIIGIDGGWGTGKSNLVKITEGKLPKNSYKFFIYDVWGHQGDDQRKAILVELTDFITKEKQVKDIKKWKDKLDRLLAKKREITTFNFPYLSIGFIFSLLSIIYIPTVNVFKDSLTDFFGIKQLFWKLLLVMFPVFIVLGIYIWNLLKGWVNRKGFCTSFKLSAQETFQVYTNKWKKR